MRKGNAYGFFGAYRITDVQFNLPMLVRYQGGEEGNLEQVDLNRMMLVNRANVTAIIDRLEKAGLSSTGWKRSTSGRSTGSGRSWTMVN